MSLYRYNLPVVIVIINNNGISFGLPEEMWKGAEEAGDKMLT